MTGFHSVWCDVPTPVEVQILWLCRFYLVSTYKVQPAGANLQIQPFILSASVIILQEKLIADLFCAQESELSMQ